MIHNSKQFSSEKIVAKFEKRYQNTVLLFIMNIIFLEPRLCFGLIQK